MRERPMLFSAPMVRAILEGRKTQTRRVVKPYEPTVARATAKAPEDVVVRPGGFSHRGCPYGAPGDRLWVKETWRPFVAHGCCMDACDCADVNVRYAADGEVRFFPDHAIDAASPDWTLPKAAHRGNVSPLFMPRWATRLVLEVTTVRVERLQDINSIDAVWEGCDGATGWDALDNFRQLWGSINGPEAWAANPWVWVVGFRQVRA